MLHKRVLNRVRSLLPLHRIQELERRLSRLERRVQNRRWAAVEEIGDYLVGAQVPGDYCEFGVFKGETFAYVVNRLSPDPNLAHMRYIAFDSFEGLPPPAGIDAVDGYSSNFHAGEFGCDRSTFVSNLRREGVDMRKVEIVEGWFDQTLTDETADRIGLKAVSAAWIDGDLYESCVPILKFLTKRISVGTIILFDDWRVFRNLPDRGEQLACREWLDQNPNINLLPLFSFGHHGAAFTVSSC
jgi:hypothetical protein